MGYLKEGNAKLMFFPTPLGLLKFTRKNNPEKVSFGQSRALFLTSKPNVFDVVETSLDVFFSHLQNVGHCESINFVMKGKSYKIACLRYIGYVCYIS